MELGPSVTGDGRAVYLELVVTSTKRYAVGELNFRDLNRHQLIMVG